MEKMQKIDVTEEKQDVNGTEQKKDTSLSKAKAALKETISWAIVICLALVVSLFITNFVIFKGEVPTGSMMSTINKGDKFVALRIFSSVERGDIVVFPAYEYSGEDEKYVKRVIGLPGETLEIKDSMLYINGNRVVETYLYEQTINDDWGPYTIPEGCVFVMGDNRNESFDARKWRNPYLKIDDIIAKAWFKYSPKFESFGKPDYTN